MKLRRENGGRRPPARVPKLMDTFQEEIARLRSLIGWERPLFIGGKSLGGRVASLLAAESGLGGAVSGVVCFGYPFHPPRKADRWRTEHFARLTLPVCILQGSRDPFGTQDELMQLGNLGPPIKLHWLFGGDHDFKPLVRHRTSQSILIDRAAEIAASFINTIASGG
nr:alpha/beta family hydrolase [Marinobacter caseinilyticus]